MESSSFVKIRIPKNISGKSPVFLVDFSNGRLNPSNSSNISFTSFKNGTGESSNYKTKRILVAESDRLTYTNSSFEDENHRRKLPVRYFVGVRSKATGKMKIFESILLHLKPVIKVTATPEVISSEQNYKERLDLLTMSFGNKAKKRAINARLKYSVNSSLSVDALEDISLDESLLQKQNSPQLNPNTPTQIDYIPPQNREAETVSDVYNILDIISEEEEEHLAWKAEILLKELPNRITVWKNDNTYCKYVLSHLDNGVDIEKAKYLLYYDYMVMFSKLVFSDFRKKDPAPVIPEPFKSKLLDYYTNSSTTETGKISRTCPRRMKDKLFAYLFVLALIIDDYFVDIALILFDFKRSLQSAVTVAQALGCHIVQRRVEDSVLKFAELKLPLFILQKYHKKRF